MLAPSQPELQDRIVALRGGIGSVPGVRVSGVHAGIKRRKRDLALIAFDREQACAAVVTTNDVKAAPITVSSEHIASGMGVRALVCNSGCANACTGERGERDARATAAQAAALLEIAPQQVIVASTGVIGVPLPLDRVQRGLERCVEQLDEGLKAAHDAAEAIMTTDRVPKLSAYAFYHDAKRYTIGGIAKGSGMIAPNMATMLAFLATDFPATQGDLQRSLAAAVDGTFNMISVDGDMSTNDAVYLCAPQGSQPLPAIFEQVVGKVALDLALAMVDDGEGATKRLEVRIVGARDSDQARAVARAIVNSSLVKTALYGEDPNWGRIIAAAGAARIGLETDRWSLALNDRRWVERGAIETLSEAEAHRELEEREIVVTLDLGLGDAIATAWGCDLSRDYVRINASYRT
uniref:Ornithine acetyltransferase amino-acid acetyltransferase n=1 Tax=mine drainage metagenome TaxID=410659 RepID=E6PHP6_9ZZZZ